MKEKEIYDKFVAERSKEINTYNNNVKYDKLMYHFKIESRTPLRFDNINRPLGFIRKIKDESIDLKKAQKKSRKI